MLIYVSKTITYTCSRVPFGLLRQTAKYSVTEIVMATEVTSRTVRITTPNVGDSKSEEKRLSELHVVL